MPLAIDIGGTKIACALVEGATVRDRLEVPTPQPANPHAVVNAVCELISSLGPVDDSPIGVAATGRVIDGSVTAVNQETMPGWNAFPLEKVLRQRLGRAVVIINDTQAAAWGEYRFGAGTRSSESFCFVSVSTGIGAGIIIGGNLLVGIRGWAGHLGFTRSANVFLEDIVSGKALSRQIPREGGGTLGVAELIAHAQQDSRARGALTRATQTLRQALGDMAVLLDISRIAIGGSVGMNPTFFRMLSSEPCHPLVDIEIVIAALGADAGLVGIAEVAART